MKMTSKSNANRKIALILLIVMIFNMIIPTYSHAGIGISLISKPLTGLIMMIFDGVNAILATVFATDEKILSLPEEAINSLKEESSSNSYFEKILDKLDKCQEIYYNTLLSPEDIFTNRVQITDANIFSEKYDENEEVNVTDWNLFNHLMKQLKQTTAALYYIMRNLAVVILLCSLIYCGIRIVLASNSSGEKAKWKMYLMDWLKALALVMLIHIVIIGIFYICEIVTDALENSITGRNTIVTNIRKNFNSTSFLDVMGVWVYCIMYIYITYLTIVFLIAYFKRLFYVIILIIIAPIMCALYSTGKTSKANFGRWMKEIVVGILVQPYHLLIYSILFMIPMNVMNSSGIALNTEGGTKLWQFSTIDAQIYSILSIAMIRPIEKYTRKIFGFGSTIIDNVTSFESGKKTIDAGKKMVTQVASDAIKIGAAVATGGASLATTGLPGQGVPGQTAPKTDNFSKSMLDSYNENFGTEDWDPLEADAMQREANTAEAEAATGVNEYLDNMQVGNDEDAQNLGYDNRKDLLEQAGFNGKEIEDALGEAADDKEKEFKGGADRLEEPGKGGALSDGQEAIFNNANVQINQADTMDVNAINTMSANSIDGLNAELEDGEGNDSDSSSDDKDVKNDILGGSDIAKALGGIVGGPLEALKNNPYYQVITSPETRERLDSSREAMHGFVDSLYIPGDASGDWKANIEYNKNQIDERKKKNINKFINNPENIEKAIEKYGLKDRTNKATGEVTTAKDQAKEKLKQLEPFVSAGIQDIDKLYALNKTGLEGKEAMRQYISDVKAENNYKYFTENQNNLESMRTIVADRMNIPESKRNDVNIRQEINQQVQQEFQEGAKYISAGAAKDSQTLDRLVQLEKKIDQQVDMKGTVNIPKHEYVVKADKIVEKAIKDNVKNIKLPGSEKIDKPGIKKLQDTLNRELKDRTGLSSGSSSSSTSSRQSGTSNSSGNTGNSRPTNSSRPSSSTNSSGNRQNNVSNSNANSSGNRLNSPQNNPPQNTNS